MKKLLIIVPVLASLLIVIMSYSLLKDGLNIDSIKFKEEYESLNNEKIKINIPNNNPIVYASYKKVIDIIENDTAVIYFGFPECPWCRNAVPVLFDAAKEMGIDKIYYYNALDIRDKKSLDNNKIVIEKEGTEEYKQLVKLMYQYLPAYEGLNDETIKRLYFPTVLFIKEGNIIGLHKSTVDTQNDSNIPLNKKQYNELKTIYTDYMNKTFDIICDESC